MRSSCTASQRVRGIRADEEQEFKEAAKHVLRLTEEYLAELVRQGAFVEVKSR